MVLEQFVVSVHPGQEAEFEVAMERALRTVMARAKGLCAWSFRRCIEAPERYQVQLEWDTIESHLIGYREGPLAPEFRAIVLPFYAQPAEMNHFTELAQG